MPLRALSRDLRRRLAAGDAKTSEEAAQIGEMMVRQFQHLADELPYSFEVVGGYVAKGGYDPTAEFEFGLDLILDGLERLRDMRPDHERRRRTGNAAGLT